MRALPLVPLLAVLIAASAAAGEVVTCEKADGYRGIWYFNQPSGDEYKYKYSGGLGTYTQQLIPFAVYARKVNRTFFCCGGRPKDAGRLLHMVAWYDHATGTVPRPRILMDKKTRDAHDNPTILLADDGHILIFSSAHGTARPAYIHRSVEPYDVDRFERVLAKNFSYAQAWRVPGKGILFLTSRGYASGPKNDPRTWRTARWTGAAWEVRPVTTSDHNYDFGPLYIEADGTWRLIAPTETGPQPYNTGGEIAMWTSADRGAAWKKVRQLTRDSEFNHTYVRRPVDARPDFYALWADGHGRRPSPSRLYFTNRAGDHVWRLPPRMAGVTARPEVAW